MLYINNKTNIKINKQSLQNLVDFIYKKLYLSEEVDLNISFVNIKEMEKLHFKWLNLPGPTDVLSFPMDELSVGDKTGILGDIVLCPEIIQLQATKAGHQFKKEKNLLIIHGLLHLLGYDHYLPEEKVVMFSIQNSILNQYMQSEYKRKDGKNDE